MRARSAARRAAASYRAAGFSTETTTTAAVGREGGSTFGQRLGAFVAGFALRYVALSPSARVREDAIREIRAPFVRTRSAGSGYYVLYQTFETSQRELERKIDALSKIVQEKSSG